MATEKKSDIVVRYADEADVKYAERICQLIFESAKARNTGIAKREPSYIAQKMTGGKAVVAVDGDRLVGFSYIECWEHGDFVATSGLIVDPEYRRMGLAARIKEKTFQLARERFPYAKLFSITTSLAVMKLNTRMGYQPVTLDKLTQDDEFWKGCEGCVNYDILCRNNRRVCLCYGMLYDPKSDSKKKPSRFSPYVMSVKNAFNKIFRIK
ncbi:MAG: GNAT family N-acetyltransferase [Prevotella sp.]|nr:GNAT family N-acetyltransferase [Prevotella sp.]